MRIACGLLLCAAWFAAPIGARAHIQMTYPMPRTSSQKTGPCGGLNAPRGPSLTVTSGSTLRVTWKETIDHPSFYRISFDADGEDAFADPKTTKDTYTNAAVLIDAIADGNTTFAIDVKLPNVECERCTLQLIQVMLDKAPYEPGTNDIYYQCADLRLVRGDMDANATMKPPAGDGGGGPVAAVDGGVNPEDPGLPESSAAPSAPETEVSERVDAGLESQQSGAEGAYGGDQGAGGDAASCTASRRGRRRSARWEWPVLGALLLFVTSRHRRRRVVLRGRSRERNCDHDRGA